MRSFEIFHRYEKTWWSLRSLPWEQLSTKDTLSPQDVKLAQAAALGEATFLPGLHSFLEGGSDDYDLSSFVSIWSYQELQHHFAFRTWLERVGVGIEQAAVDETRPPFPEGHTLAQTLCSNIIGELVVCHYYARLAELTKDPVLKAIFINASADEGRHARGFADYTRMQLDRHPESMMSVLETLYYYAADKKKPVKHPSDVFKGQLSPDLQSENVSIGEGFLLFAEVADDDMERLRRRVFGTFSSLTGYKLENARSIRRAMSEELKKHPKIDKAPPPEKQPEQATLNAAVC